MSNRANALYQSEAVFISSGLATGYHFNTGFNGAFTGANAGNNLLLQLHRIQSAGQDFTVNRLDIGQEGQLARLDSLITESPTVSFNTSWYITDGSNEQKAGLIIDGATSCISGLISKTTEPKNLFVLQTAVGLDAINNANTHTADDGVISIGNCFLSNISWNAAVGQIPTATATWEAFNIKFDTGTRNIDSPAVDITNGQAVSNIKFTVPQATAGTGTNIPNAIKPGDVTLQGTNTSALGIYMSGANACPVQSFTLSIPLARTRLNKLGSLFAYSLEPQFPVKPTLSVEVYATDLRNSNLADVLCNDQPTNFKINMKNPACGGNGSDAVIFFVNQAKLVSESFNQSYGALAKTVSLQYELSIGGAGDNINGVFISGQGKF